MDAGSAVVESFAALVPTKQGFLADDDCKFAMSCFITLFDKGIPRCCPKYSVVQLGASVACI